MKIKKNSQIDTSNITEFYGIWYKMHKKMFGDVFMCEAPEDFNGKVCDTCPIWKQCSNGKEYYVWKRISKLYKNED